MLRVNAVPLHVAAARYQVPTVAANEPIVALFWSNTKNVVPSVCEHNPNCGTPVVPTHHTPE
jgi:hypothetical protein